jgi:hypothetical protein
MTTAKEKGGDPCESATRTTKINDNGLTSLADKGEPGIDDRLGGNWIEAGRAE